MKHLFLLICTALLSMTAQAQSTYTEKLRKYEDGKGVVVVTQSPEIEGIVNGTIKPKAKKTTPTQNAVRKDTTNAGGTDTEGETTPGMVKRTVRVVKRKNDPNSYTTRVRHKARGYRICIFTGGNSRADKTKATQMANKCRQRFPELSVYTSFISPRWVTHVGDFKTKQDAQKYIGRIRNAKFTYEARIVETEVNLPE